MINKNYTFKISKYYQIKHGSATLISSENGLLFVKNTTLKEDLYSFCFRITFVQRISNSKKIRLDKKVLRMYFNKTIWYQTKSHFLIRSLWWERNLRKLYKPNIAYLLYATNSYSLELDYNTWPTNKSVIQATFAIEQYLCNDFIICKRVGLKSSEFLGKVKDSISTNIIKRWNLWDCRGVISGLT